MPVVMKISELIAPLCNDPQCVFEESDDDQEAPDGWEISMDRERSAMNCGLLFVCEGDCEDVEETHGFTGSESVSSQSSILLVCSRIASSGLGSLVSSCLLGPPPKEGWKLF